MPIAHKSAISFGLVHIPVGLYKATQENDIRFNQLCKEDLSRVRYKKVCSECGKEVLPKDIVKGFEYEDEKFVVVTEADFEKIKTEADKTIRILHFTDVAEIRPVYFDKAYHLVPEKGGEKAFELLRTAMAEENKIAVAQAVLGSKDTLLVILAQESGLIIETLYFEDEIKEVPKAYNVPELKPAELKMAKNLISGMTQPFDASQYEDEYQQRLRSLIEKKIAGENITGPKKQKQGNVIDLMDALKQSLNEQKTKKPSSRAPAAKKRKGA